MITAVTCAIRGCGLPAVYRDRCAGHRDHVIGVSNIPMLQTVRWWYCPNCKKEAVTTEPRPHTEFHNCPKMRGLTAPMIPAGTKAKITSHEREDYLNGDIVRTDEAGRPIMSITTEREEGQDVVVFAPTATGRIG